MKNKELKEFVYNNVYQNTTNGYVLTPSELAFEMVSKLPESAFESESTTFLDPICKSGTFLFEIVERLYDKGHSVKNIESRIYTIDSNFHSLNVAKSTIRQILNKCSGSFKIDYTNDWIERFYNRSISHISQGKYTTFDDFMNIIILDKNKKELMTLLKNSISDFIQQYEKVSKLESKLFGEVFTPRQLIEEMLDSLPAEIWKNKDLKWLDPAVGVGNFPSVVLDRLMIGLEEVIPNEEERRKHILEEMLYMCDISIKNLFLLYKLFDCNNEYKLNVHRGSFLEEDFDEKIKNDWNISGFDIVIGNPPYQDTSDKQKGTTGKKNLYQKFIIKIIDILNNDGYINFVNPPAFLKTTVFDKSTDIFKVIKEYNLEYLNLTDINVKFFGVGTPICYFLLKKNKEYNSTKVETDEGIINIDIQNYNFVPRLLFKSSMSIISKSSSIGNNFDVKRDTKSIGGNFITFKRLNHINKNGKYNPVVGSETLKYDLTLEVEYPESMCRLLDMKLYRFLNYTCRHDGVLYHYFINGFRYPENYHNIENDNDLYNYFNLTQEEIELIEKTIKD
jgi:hypothetical protein